MMMLKMKLDGLYKFSRLFLVKKWKITPLLLMCMLEPSAIRSSNISQPIGEVASYADDEVISNLLALLFWRFPSTCASPWVLGIGIIIWSLKTPHRKINNRMDSRRGFLLAIVMSACGKWVVDLEKTFTT